VEETLGPRSAGVDSEFLFVFGAIFFFFLRWRSASIGYCVAWLAPRG
jgi:hypothetical protein